LTILLFILFIYELRIINGYDNKAYMIEDPPNMTAKHCY